jgi:hypothetical protein
VGRCGRREICSATAVVLLQVSSLVASLDARALTSQAITFPALSGKTFGAAPFTISGTASSGLAVSFASLATPACTVAASIVTIQAAGTCTIQASQAGDAIYAAAPPVNQNFTVAKAAQTITFGALGGKTYGAVPFAVSATSSSGLAVIFVSTTSIVCTVSGATVTIVGGGTCTIQARQSGNSNYNAAANVNQTFAVAKAIQSIAFAPLPNKTYGNPPFTVSATVSSRLAVTFSSSTTTVCAVSGNTVTIVTGGTCTVKASQPGNANYVAAAAISQSFTITRANQTISFGAMANSTFGVVPFTVGATASSGLAVTFASTTTTVCMISGSTVTIRAAGTCTILAAQAGNTSYNSATSVSRSFTVVKSNQTITFGALANQTFGVAPFTVNATASSALPVAFASLALLTCTISGGTVTLAAPGTCTIRATQAGDASFAAATPVDRSFTVGMRAIVRYTYDATGNVIKIEPAASP